MTAPVQRKLPGTPIPREELVARWADLRHRNNLAGPLTSLLFELYYPEPEKTYQWRIQLDCGCVRDVLTHHRADDNAADKVERLGELTDRYYFGLVKPSEREIRESKDRANKQTEDEVHAEPKGIDLPAEPERPGVYGKARLQQGHLLCQHPDCPRYRPYGGPVRDITEWVRLRDNRFVNQPMEIDGEIIGVARDYEVWDVVLSCGHFEQERTEPGWTPEDGPARRKNPKRLPLDRVLEEVAKGDPDQEDYWRRMYAENHPEPAPFTRCHTCAQLRTIVAYQRVGWLAGKKTPVRPTPTPREALERRLLKLESQAVQLREQLDNLPLDK
ncbi:hypothetical protein [Mycobacterium paragordonae]|uniref:Uncharacterized protein n=1 Tax=Mycobacterium paragordonae TaxID=1389713 RepID=A0AAJ1S221_9MYCO|nr:hypothetical protein [Mycobacterium paragordonae]MDP7735130.1 hypothetical protein [Mycobacterium paragordonae]